MIEGGCFCKNIRYTIDEGDFRIANCHCRMCQQTSGAPFVTWLDIACGSLDNPDDFVPTAAVHEESKLKWLKQTE